ncbi:MAG: 4-oxalocrotonate tautomerase family enzyme [Nocardioides sp.]|jgi:4-oxalocrotonate tautomerase|nr:4-oxalocrotonate tautomerase family enzyme [Nocardioides sp.]
MPVVHVHTWEGRTVEQKRGLVAAITAAMVEHFDSNPDRTHVILHDIPLDSWGRNGELGVDLVARGAASSVEPPG